MRTSDNYRWARGVVQPLIADFKPPKQYAMRSRVNLRTVEGLALRRDLLHRLISTKRFQCDLGFKLICKLPAFRHLRIPSQVWDIPEPAVQFSGITSDCSQPNSTPCSLCRPKPMLHQMTRQNSRHKDLRLFRLRKDPRAIETRRGRPRRTRLRRRWHLRQTSCALGLRNVVLALR